VILIWGIGSIKNFQRMRGKFRTGAAGEAVSIIESEPYYIDPKTGKEIPVSFLRRFKK